MNLKSYNKELLKASRCTSSCVKLILCHIKLLHIDIDYTRQKFFLHVELQKFDIVTDPTYDFIRS